MPPPQNNKEWTAAAQTATRRKSRPSLRDLAASLGVSHTSVNLALQDDARISKALRVRIRETAEREGYFPNDLATVLRTGHTRMIGVLVPRINSGYVSGIMDPAIQILWEAGYFPVTVCSHLDRVAEAQMLESLARQRVEGVLIMPSREDTGKRHFAELLKQHIPIVTINNPIPKLDLPLVSSDDILGARIVTRYLIRLGHKNILHIAALHDSPYADLRRETGYCDTLKEAGLKPRVLYYDDRRNRNISKTLLKKALLEQSPAQRPTAVFCYNDVIALRLYEFCHTAGIRIPDDLSVVGYSNEGWSSSIHALNFVAPPLTTVDQNTDKIGATAAKTLLAHMDHEVQGSERLLIEPTFVERASAATPKPVPHQSPDSGCGKPASTLRVN